MTPKTRRLPAAPALLTAVTMGTAQLSIWCGCGRPLVGVVAALVTSAGWLVLALGCRD